MVQVAVYQYKTLRIQERTSSLAARKVQSLHRLAPRACTFMIADRRNSLSEKRLARLVEMRRQRVNESPCRALRLYEREARAWADAGRLGWAWAPRRPEAEPRPGLRRERPEPHECRAWLGGWGN